jgi:hypothetical protein
MSYIHVLLMAIDVVVVVWGGGVAPNLLLYPKGYGLQVPESITIVGLSLIFSNYKI